MITAAGGRSFSGVTYVRLSSLGMETGRFLSHSVVLKMSVSLCFGTRSSLYFFSFGNHDNHLHHHKPVLFNITYVNSSLSIDCIPLQQQICDSNWHQFMIGSVLC